MLPLEVSPALLCTTHPVATSSVNKLKYTDCKLHLRRARQKNENKAATHVRAGNKSDAYQCYQRAVDVLPSTVQDVVKVISINSY